MHLRTLGVVSLVIACVIPVAYARAEREGEDDRYQFLQYQYNSEGGSELKYNWSDNSKSSQSQNTSSGSNSSSDILGSLFESMRSDSKKKTVDTTSPIAPNSSAPRVLIEQVAQGSAQIPAASLSMPTSTASASNPSVGAPSTSQQQSSQFIESIGQAIGTYIQQVSQPNYPQAPAAPVEPPEIPIVIEPAASAVSVDIATVSPQVITVPITIKTPTTSSEKTSKSSASRKEERDQKETTKQLEDIGKVLHGINTSKKSVEKKVETIVAEKVQETVQTAAKVLPAASTEPIRFSEMDRERILTEVRTKAEERGRTIPSEIAETIAAPDANRYIPGRVDPVLKSSLVDIESIVLSETGVAVDIVPGARAVSESVQEIEETARQIDQQRQQLAARQGLELYRDVDQDGVSDYDEKNIYYTDPNNAYTAGSALTDGERILLGFDAHSPTPALVPVESPKVAGEETKAMFEVTEIALVPVATVSAETSIAKATTSESAPAIETAVQIKGKALPNSFVTLYIYSDPIVVTVKADENGEWTYTLDTQLPDGNHEIYVASVNNSGKIIAKSSPVAFTKTAEALEFEPLTIQGITEPSPLDTLRDNFLVLGGVLLAIFALVALAAVGVRREPVALGS